MNREPPISEELYHGLVKVRISTSPEGEISLHEPTTGYAAGLEIERYCGYQIVTHGGLVSGFHSLFFFLPELKFGAVLLGNTGDDNVRTNFPAIKIAIELLDEVLKDKTCDDTTLLHAKTRVPVAAQCQQSASKHEARSEPREVSTKDAPLHVYTGQYCNPGYHCLVVSIKSGALFIDGTDRSEAFTIRFEALHNYTAFVAHMTDYWEGGDDIFEATFEIVEGEAMRMGIFLEDELDDYIWFHKVPQDERSDQIVVGIE